jgi:hypothetical protein
MKTMKMKKINTTIVNMTFNSLPDNGTGMALLVQDCQNTTVENCLFNGPADRAIAESFIVSPSHNLFLNNKFGYGVAQAMEIRGEDEDACVIPGVEN